MITDDVVVTIHAAGEAVVKALQEVAAAIVKGFQPLINYDYQVEKWVRSLPTRGWTEGDFTYLIVRDTSVPGCYVVLKEPTPLDIPRSLCYYSNVIS